MDFFNKLVDLFKDDTKHVYDVDKEELPKELREAGIVGVTSTLTTTAGTRKISAAYVFQDRAGNLSEGKSREYTLVTNSDGGLRDEQMRKFVIDEMLIAFHSRT